MTFDLKASWAAFGAVAVAGLLGSAALAQPPQQTYKLNPNAPLNVGADKTTTDPVSCTTPMEGRVDITQDRTRLRANKVTAINTKTGGKCSAKVSRLEAQGNVFYVTPDRAIRADNAIYDLNGKQVTFTGNVVAVQGKDVSTADQMVFNTDTDAAVMSGHVRGVVYPEEKSAAK